MFLSLFFITYNIINNLLYHTILTNLIFLGDWEGPEALEEVPVGATWPGESNGSQSPRGQEKKPKEVYKEEEIFSSEDKDDGSEDEYVAESSRKRIIKGKVGQA